MFEHLDDPSPPLPDGATRRAVAGRVARRRRRQQALIGAAAGLVLVAGGTAVAVTSAGGHQSVTVATKPAITAASTAPTDTAAPTTAPRVVAPPPTTTLPPPLLCAPLEPPGATQGARQAAVSDGTITATLSGSAGTAYGEPSLTGARLTVADGNRTILSVPVAPPKSPSAPTTAVIPWGITEGDTFTSAPLCLARFAGNSRPTVVLGLNLGGAHCCTILRAIDLTGTGVSAPVDDDLGNPGAVMQAVGDHAVIVTGDDSFNYTFASFAGSGVAIKVLEFHHGAFVEVTRQHLDLVATDAGKWWSAYTANASDGLGLLAAWVGDECLLGRTSQAWATVDQLQAQGKLTSASGGNWPTGAAYVSKLHQFLAGRGYCP